MADRCIVRAVLLHVRLDCSGADTAETEIGARGAREPVVRVAGGTRWGGVSQGVASVHDQRRRLAQVVQARCKHDTLQAGQVAVVVEHAEGHGEDFRADGAALALSHAARPPLRCSKAHVIATTEGGRDHGAVGRVDDPRVAAGRDLLDGRSNPRFE